MHALAEHLRLRTALRGWLGPGPDFIIAGAQKCGTTSLYRWLAAHPRVAEASKKEVHFFDLNYHKGRRWYQRHFPSALERLAARRRGNGRLLAGEASPYYLFHPHALRRIRQAMPEVKLIVLLRNPIDRAYSHYWHNVRHGREPLSFEEAIEREPERLRSETEKMRKDERYRSFAHQHYSYLARGVYAEQLLAMWSHFPRAQALVLKSETFYAEPGRTLREVLGFLRLLPPREPQRLRVENAGRYPAMGGSLRRRLAAHFQAPNQRLHDCLGGEFQWD